MTHLPRRALVVVDVQNDFTEGGRLSVAGGDAAAHAIGAWTVAHRGEYALVVTTQDHHIEPGDHFSDAPDFADSWPEHCVAGTPGAELDPQLSAGAGRPFAGLVDAAVRKGAYAAAYSGFEGVDTDGRTLAELLQAAGITDVDVVGIATSFCVRATALDAVAAGLAARLLPQLCADVDPAQTPATLAELGAAGVQIAAGTATAPGAGTVLAADPMRNRTMSTYTPEDDAERAFLDSYDPRAFPPVAASADVAVLTIRDDALCVLLVRRGDYPYRGAWALPGGFVRPDEDADTAARRVLSAETGIARPAGHLEQLGSYTDPHRDPRMRVLSIAHLALLPHAEDPVAGGDADAARFVPVDDVLDGALPLAFDHAQILRDALERAAAKLEYTTLATAFCEPEFTIPQLRRVYELIWRTALPGSNFHRKVSSTPGFVEASGRVVTGGRGRAAQLFRPGAATLMMPPLLRPAVRTELAAARAQQEAAR